MYDLPGTDTDREWLEIHNDGDTTIDLKNWKIDDGDDAKHGLNEPPKNGGKGDLKIGPNEYIILADKANVFLLEHIGFSKKVIDTVLDLGNKGETISLIDEGGAVADSLSYSDSMGGKDDENSLHRKNNILEAGMPTPGEPYNNQQIKTEEVKNVVSNNTASNQSSFPVEPRIFTSILGEKVVMVGVETIFKNETIGIDKKPITNARAIWSFGDGVIKEGQTMSHTYLQPGTYMLVLNVSSGEFTASAKQKVDVINADLSIHEIKTGSEGYVSIKNNSNYDLDISRFIIISGGKNFILPQSTFILAKSVLPLDNRITGLSPEMGNVEFFYPNGQKITSLTKTVSNIPKVETKIISVKQDVSSEKTIPKLIDSQNTSQNDTSSSTVIYSASVGNSSSKTNWVLALSALIGVTVFGVLFSIGRNKELVEVVDNMNLENNNKTAMASANLKAEDFNIIEEDDEYNSK